MFKDKRNTKIIATIGPVTWEPDMIAKVIKAGANVLRFNLSHVNYSLLQKNLQNVRKIAAELNQPIAILFDLQGPKIRIGTFRNGSVILKTGDEFTITTDDVEGTEQIVSTTYKYLVTDAKKGDNILLDDGRIRLKVAGVSDNKVLTNILVGGVLSDHKGMNLPKMKLTVQALSDKDLKDAVLGIQNDIDYFALSFVRSAEDVLALRELLDKNQSKIKIISKIEKPEAVENIESIIEVSDGIMVARGDLGIEVSFEKVPSIQKDLVAKANYHGKPVIVATQMLESMIQNPTPTRAEISDVATAIYDKADAVMLSGETAMGKYPIEAIEIINLVALEVEKGQTQRKRNLRMRQTHFLKEKSIVSSLCDSADELADEIGAKAIITFTDSGRTALLLSKYRVSVPIIALTDNRNVYWKMALYRGVVPVVTKQSFEKISGIKVMLKEAETAAIDLCVVKKGDLVVMISGITIAKTGATNMIRVHTIGGQI